MRAFFIRKVIEMLKDVINEKFPVIYFLNQKKVYTFAPAKQK